MKPFCLKFWRTIFQQPLGCRCGRMHLPPAERSLDRRDMVELANETIKRALEIYEPGEIMLCFNGGKDCTVLLDLLAKLSTPPLQAVYVKSADTFEELDKFVENCPERYQLQIKRYEGALKVAIKQAVGEHPKVRAMFLGCRRTDTSCSQLTEMVASDIGWPAMMRIFPLLEWSYHDIWNYIRAHKLPYCYLYDQGYTSLGDRSTTHLNPSLLYYDKEHGEQIYRAAHELQDIRLERASRDENGQA